MEFVLGLQQAEEDLDWVGFFMIMVIMMVLVMVRKTWAGWVAIFSLIIFFIRKVMVMAIGASIVKNCFM